MTSSGRRSSISLERARLQAARVAGVAVVAASRARLLPVTAIFSALTTTTKSPVSTCGVYVGLALAAQRVGDLGREPAEGLALGVDEQPVALAVGGCGDVGLHGRAEAPRGRAAAADA